MKNINLYHKDFKSPEGSISYDILRFPDNEVQIRFNGNGLSALMRNSTLLQIKAPIRNSDELFILLQVLTLTKGMPRSIEIPYIMGARNDRYFEDGRAINATVVSDILSIYLTEDDHISLIDVHSEFIINKLIAGSGVSLSMYKPFPEDLVNTSYYTIFPDKGAFVRYNKNIRYNEYAIAEKERNLNTGWINKYNIELNGLRKDDKIVIVDDLVDGGSTFRMLAEELKDIPNEKILVVTHFIQPNALLALTNYYDMIYITNSYGSELTHPKIKVEDVRR